MAFVERLVGVFVAAALIAFVIAMGGDGEFFFHAPSLIFVLLLVLAGMLMSFRPSQILRALEAGLTQNKKNSREEFAQHILVLDRAHQLAWAGGFLVFTMALIQMLATLNTPDQIGLGIAAGTLPLFYGVVLAEFLINPLKYAVMAASLAAHPDAGSGQRGASRTTTLFVLTACCLLIALVVLQFLAFSGPTTPALAPHDHYSDLFDERLPGQMPDAGPGDAASQPASASQPARREPAPQPRSE